MWPHSRFRILAIHWAASWHNRADSSNLTVVMHDTWNNETLSSADNSTLISYYLSRGLISKDVVWCKSDGARRTTPRPRSEISLNQLFMQAFHAHAGIHDWAVSKWDFPLELYNIPVSPNLHPASCTFLFPLFSFLKPFDCAYSLSLHTAALLLSLIRHRPPPLHLLPSDVSWKPRWKGLPARWAFGFLNSCWVCAASTLAGCLCRWQSWICLHYIIYYLARTNL